MFLSAKQQTMQKVLIFSAMKCKELQALSDGFLGPPTAVFSSRVFWEEKFQTKVFYDFQINSLIN